MVWICPLIIVVEKTQIIASRMASSEIPNEAGSMAEVGACQTQDFHFPRHCVSQLTIALAVHLSRVIIDHNHVEIWDLLFKNGFERNSKRPRPISRGNHY